MNFVHISILAGLASAAIPLMLHMLGRKQPQLIDFPALRFVRKTQLEQSTSWKLRHFLLLLLRILLFVVLVLALARPRVHSASMGSMVGISGLIILAALASLAAAIAWASKRPLAIWVTATLIALLLWGGAGVWGYRALAFGPALPTSDTTAPVAVGMIIDTSPTMNYQASNQTRLQAAKEMAAWVLGRMPVDSHVGVFNGIPIGSLAQSPQGATTQIERIERTTPLVDLLDRLRTAVDLVLSDELERKEIYIITDMNSAAWGVAQPELTTMIEQVKDQVLIQVVDVGVTESINWQLGDPQVDLNTVPVDGDVTIRVPVTQSTSGKQTATAVTVELWQEEIDPKLPVINSGKLQLPNSTVAARSVVNFTDDGTVEVELLATRLKEGIHHFTIKLDKNDPLPIDNQRFVSITAKRQQPTLVVANNSEAANVLALVLAPSKSEANSLVTTMNYAQLPQAVLTRYSVIVLFDPGSLAENLVQSLKEHVSGGGGLLIIMGPTLEGMAANLNNAPIASLLPGQAPTVLSRPHTDRNSFWMPTATTHPVYQELGSANDIAWQLMPIFRSWTFGSLKEGTQVLASISGTDAPLFTAQDMGNGQIHTLTTPIPEFDKARNKLWNELWISEQYFWTFGILTGSVQTLSGANQTALTFSAGASVNLENDTNQWPKKWELFTPSAERQSFEANNGLLAVGSHTDVGTYHLRGRMGDAMARGFSLNVAAADTAIERTDSTLLDTLLGKDNYRLARKQDEVESSVGQARFGRELYPLLMLFVAGIFLAEQVMSNRFYRIQLRYGKAA
jgi:uncharacterized membrane protein